MNKKKIGEKTDSLLEAEMIKEAKMIEESLLGNAANDFEISDEELSIYRITFFYIPLHISDHGGLHISPLYMRNI